MQLDKVFELEDLLRNTGSSDRYQYTVGQRKLCQVQATLNPFFNLRAVLQWFVTVCLTNSMEFDCWGERSAERDFW